MPKKAQLWNAGDIFSVQQKDGQFSVGQVLDLMIKNVVSCAFFDIRFSGEPPSLTLVSEKLISCASVTRDALDKGDWKVIGRQNIIVGRAMWPNERFRAKKWVGAKIYDSIILDSFLNAFYGLDTWDKWHDPNYLDRLLISPDKKPKNIILGKGL